MIRYSEFHVGDPTIFSLIHRIKTSENTLCTGSVTSSLRNYGEKKYAGVSAPPWKKRFGNRKLSFNKRQYEENSTLAKEVWHIKDKGGEYHIDWRVIGHAAAYNPVSKRCNLCLLEKLYIAENTGESLINKRNELISKCRHMNKYALMHHNLSNSDHEKQVTDVANRMTLHCN